MKKENRLNKLLNTLDECQWEEEYFDYLYKKLREERKRELALNERSSFAHQLLLTINGQARPYMAERKMKPLERHQVKYGDFISNFRQDILMFGLK